MISVLRGLPGTLENPAKNELRIQHLILSFLASWNDTRSCRHGSPRPLLFPKIEDLTCLPPNLAKKKKPQKPLQGCSKSPPPKPPKKHKYKKLIENAWLLKRDDIDEIENPAILSALFTSKKKVSILLRIYNTIDKVWIIPHRCSLSWRRARRGQKGPQKTTSF